MRATVALERPEPAELAELLAALGWGQHAHQVLEFSIRAYTATICARCEGRLVGYTSIFSDRCLTTMFGEFVVHPDFQRKGVGRAMMSLVESEFPLAPIYAKALGEAVGFYTALGFRASSTPVTSMFKRPSGKS